VPPIAAASHGPDVDDPRPGPDDPVGVAPADGGGGSALTALPVALALRGALTDPVRRVVEGSLGWQPVDELTAGLVPPAVRLVDVTAPAGDGTPAVLLVTPDDAPRDAADAARRLRAVAVVDWPGTQDDLEVAVARAVGSPRAAGRRTPLVRLGGAGGGVGTTTVALALAGACAWRGRNVLVASGDEVLLPDGCPTIDPAALAAPDLWTRAGDLEGVPGARVVRTIGSVDEVTVADASVDLLVFDAGVASDVDVLVVRPDAAGIAALARTTAAVVVVVGAGPASPRAVTEAIGGRRRLDLPWSVRVGRAGLVGRVPASLPGSFVRALLPLAPPETSG
jgi:hypothetical protein